MIKNGHPHENDPDYGWGPAGHDPSDPFAEVPKDLERFYREFKTSHWGYVCPACGHVWAPGFAGMPNSFRAHIRDWFDGKGCFFAPKAASASVKGAK